MPGAKDLNPTASPAAFFGAELRRLRTKAGWTQEQLGDRINYSGALVGAVETADRKPQLDFARRCDQLVGSDGLLGRLWELARVETFPGWFRPWLDVEREARALRSWEPLVIPGLLQTAGYAREMLRAGRPGVTDGQIDELVGARLERQTILCGDDPPLQWFVVDEGVLHRQIGEPTGDARPASSPCRGVQALVRDGPGRPALDRGARRTEWRLRDRQLRRITRYGVHGLDR